MKKLFSGKKSKEKKEKIAERAELILQTFMLSHMLQWEPSNAQSQQQKPQEVKQGLNSVVPLSLKPVFLKILVDEISIALNQSSSAASSSPVTISLYQQKFFNLLEQHHIGTDQLVFKKDHKSSSGKLSFKSSFKTSN